MINEMKNSEVDWIGYIPTHWQVLKNKHIFKRVKNIVGSDSDKHKVLSLTLNGVIERDIESNVGKMPETFDTYQIVEEGNLLMCLFDIDVTPRTVGHVDLTGIVSPAYTYLEVDKEKADSKYYYYWYLNLDFSKELLHLSKNLRSSIGINDFGVLPIPYPPLEEQKIISKIIEQKCDKIERLITKSNDIIDKLREYKQTFITKVVTTGIDRNRSFKNSKLTWWKNEIPLQFEELKLKKILKTSITDGPHETPNLLDSGIPFISAEAIKDNKIDLNLKRGYIDYEDHLKFCKKCKPELNDIFMIKSGATTGNIAIVETTEEFSVWSPLALIRSDENKCYYKYLFYLLLSDYFKKQVELGWNYGTQQNIGMKVLGNLLVLVPEIDEQHQIVKYIEKKCKKIDEIIKNKELLISKLEQYKKSLIYEYVTGKKKN